MEKAMKKLLSIFAATVLTVLPAFAGKLVINTNTSDPAPKQAFEKLVEDFEKENPDVDVELNIFDHEAYKTAIRNFLQANPPDVATWFAGNRMKFFIKAFSMTSVTYGSRTTCIMIWHRQPPR
jgi:multiple sugar transport system substrate-binding protein